MRLALADEVADGGRRDEHLGRDDAAAAVSGLGQLLADDALERAGELDADLLLLVRREDVDDAVDRLAGVLGVQGGEDEVAGLGRGQRDEIVSRSRISPTRMMSGSCRSTCLSAAAKEWVSSPTSRWLTTQPWCRWRNSIGSSTVMMWSRRGAVGEVDERGERRGLAGPGRAGHEHEATGQLREVADTVGGHAELLQRLDLVRDDAERGADRVALLVEVDAEAGLTGHGVARSRAPARSSNFSRCFWVMIA